MISEIFYLGQHAADIFLHKMLTLQRAGRYTSGDAIAHLRWNSFCCTTLFYMIEVVLVSGINLLLAQISVNNTCNIQLIRFVVEDGEGKVAKTNPALRKLQ